MQRKMPIYNLCRICLTEDTNTKAMQALFDSQNALCADIVKKIEVCGGIVLRPHEELPKMICQQCLDCLNTSYKFRSMCQESEHALLDAIVKSELKSEEKEFSATHSIISSPTPENQLFFDLRTEFIDAEDVEYADMAAVSDVKPIDYVDDCDGINENAHNMLYSGSDDDSGTEKKAIYKENSKDEQVMVKAEADDEDASLDEDTNVKINSTVPRKLRNKRNIVRPQHTICNKKKKPKRQPIVREPDAKRNKGRKQVEIATADIMCEICGNKYTKQSLLNMHMRRHMAEKPFSCEICSKKFACPSEMRRHMRVHTGEKPYVCRFCGRTFADRSSNIKHERIHTNERPFKCNTCDKSFTYSNVLKNHMLTHTGEKPFSCLPCNKTFSRKHQLDQHCGTLTHQQTVKNLTATYDTDPKDNTNSISQISTHE